MSECGLLSIRELSSQTMEHHVPSQDTKSLRTLTITGLTEPHQGTPGRMPDSGYSDQTQLSLQRKSNRDPGSSVERLSFGSVSFVVSSAELPRL